MTILTRAWPTGGDVTVPAGAGGTRANTTSPHLGEQECLSDAGSSSPQRVLEPVVHPPRGSCTQQGGTRP